MMEPQIRPTRTSLYLSILPAPEGPVERDPVASARIALQDLRNHLLVFYSASAWVRSQRGAEATTLRDATAGIEHAADSLRSALHELLSVSDFVATLTPGFNPALRRFLAATDHAMVTLRRSLALCGTEGLELLADLEAALVHMWDAARSLSVPSLRPSPVAA